MTDENIIQYKKSIYKIKFKYKLYFLLFIFLFTNLNVTYSSYIIYYFFKTNLIFFKLNY